MRDIAGQARVPLGLLRYYFGGKLKLWQASVDSAFAEIQSGLDLPLDDSTSADDLSGVRLAIRTHVQYVARNPEFVRLMHDEGKRRGPRMRWLVDRHVRPLYESMIGMLRRAQGRGLLPAHIDPIHFHYVLAGSVGLIFHQAEECKRLSGLDPSDPAVVEDHARVVEHLFLGPASEETHR